MSDVILEQNNEIISVGELNNAARKLLSLILMMFQLLVRYLIYQDHLQDIFTSL